MTNELDLILRKFHTEKYPEYQTLCVLPSKESSLLVYLISTNRPYCGHSTQSFSHKLDTSQFDVLVDFDEFWDYEKSMEVIVRHRDACNATGRVSIKPQPAYAVGDWVTDGIVTGYIKRWGMDMAWVKTQDAEYHINLCNLRKLDPSEVRIKVTLEGTIHRWDSTTFYMFHGNCKYSKIHINALDSETATLVKALLKAQEEK